jgi:DNA topoisomerase-3
MGLKLVIAEKPSVAQSIAKVIGAEKKQDGYLEGNGYLVSWCFGHLIELAAPDAYDPKYQKWRKEDLPIFLDPFRYEVTESTKKQFRKLQELMKREDVTSLVEATDSGREGELIFRLVYHKAGCRKPFERLWISSMEDKAIEEGFRNLRPSSEYDALYEAALCRERADWIVGINATRLFSCLYGQTLNVGRVMTPTLAMLAARQEEIDTFKSEPFYSVRIKAAGVEAEGRKCKDRAEAENILQAVNDSGKAKVESLQKMEKSEKPPLLYDLTTLQREANRRYGFTAQQTLDYTQSLYEKKLVTYPRTDSRYLTDEMEDSVKVLACLMKEKYGFTGIVYLNPSQVINSKKVSDHHAIIPTENAASADFSQIPYKEQKILGLVTAELLAALGRPCLSEEYRLSLDCAGKKFTASAKRITDPGWHEIQDWILGKDRTEEDSQETETGCSENTINRNASGSMAPGENTSAGDTSDENTSGENTANEVANSINLADVLAADPSLLAEGREVIVQDPEIRTGKTQPKKPYTENTLLSAMERAGSSETPDEAERKGLGTPATRAGIIEKLVRIGFVERKGSNKTKYLIPTHKGISLVTVMPEQIRSPLLTAQWEQKLIEVEKKNLPPEEFMREIEADVQGLVDTYEAVQDAGVMAQPNHNRIRDSIGKCPACGSSVTEKSKGFFCSNRGCRFALWKENRYFDSIGKKMTKQIAEELLSTGKVNLRKCRSRKSGKTYDATLLLDTDDKGQATFRMEFPDRKRK